MTAHSMIEGTKRYRDGKTGQEYRFEWMQFWEAAYAAAEQESISKEEARLAEAAHISKKAVHDHLQNVGFTTRAFRQISASSAANDFIRDAD